MRWDGRPTCTFAGSPGAPPSSVPNDRRTRMTTDLFRAPHRRFNPLTGDWILVSPQRTLRPWQGSVERPQTETPPRYDPGCYLCPGNARAGQERNPQYTGTF